MKNCLKNFEMLPSIYILCVSTQYYWVKREFSKEPRPQHEPMNITPFVNFTQNAIKNELKNLKSLISKFLKNSSKNLGNFTLCKQLAYFHEFKSCGAQNWRATVWTTNIFKPVRTNYLKKNYKMNKFKSRRRSGTGLKRSPAKGRSPFKKRSVSKLASNEIAEDIPENATVTPAPANIRVAVRVRPENEREINSNNR